MKAVRPTCALPSETLSCSTEQIIAHLFYFVNPKNKINFV